MQDFSWLLIT